MKDILKKIFSLAAAAFVMLVIFSFSSRTATVSSGQSSRITSLICRIIFFRYKDMSADEQLFLCSALDPFIRKLAHFAIYALLGMAVYASACFIGAKGASKPLMSVSVCGIYAALDEFHQSFVPGRAMQLKDVLLDCAGSLCGIIVCGIIFILIEHFTVKKQI